jgi:HPt (histidine-containing phosphotransfer) domain-containing protein
MIKNRCTTGELRTDCKCHAQILATQLIDPGTIATYHQLSKLKKQNVVQLILGKYLTYSQAAIADLCAKIQTLDFKSIELIAHTLKSSSAQVGAFSLSALFEQIEIDAERHQKEALNDTKITEIIALQADVHQALEYIASNTDGWLNSGNV